MSERQPSFAASFRPCLVWATAQELKHHGLSAYWWLGFFRVCRSIHTYFTKKKEQREASLGRGRRHGDHCDIAPARRVTRSFGFLPRLTPGVASLCAVPSPGSPSSLLRRRRPGFKSSIGCDVRGAMRRSVSAPIHGSVAFA